MKNSAKLIKESIQLFNEDHHQDQLNSIYHKIPSGSCNGCGNCCEESVHLFYSEFLSIYQYLEKENKVDETLEKVKTFHRNEWAKPQKCVFLTKDNLCEIYAVRPLVCRLFGHKSKHQHNKDYKKIKKRNKSVDQAVYIEYGVHISKEVLNHKIKFCKSFESDKVLSPEARTLIMDEMYGLEMNYLTADIISDEDFEKSLTQWFIDYFIKDYKDPRVKIEAISRQ